MKPPLYHTGIGPKLWGEALHGLGPREIRVAVHPSLLQQAEYVEAGLPTEAEIALHERGRDALLVCYRGAMKASQTGGQCLAGLLDRDAGFRRDLLDTGAIVVAHGSWASSPVQGDAKRNGPGLEPNRAMEPGNDLGRAGFAYLGGVGECVTQ